MLNVEFSQAPIKTKRTKKRPRCRPRRKRIYRISNWPAYNTGLKARGRVGFWLSPEVLAGWRYQGPRYRGGPYQYSDQAIETGLILRLVYHLPWRQTEGFLDSLLACMGMSLAVPDDTTLARRSARLIPSLNPVVGDSTGLKVFGEGEWKVRQHSYAKRRTWLKLHAALEERTGQVVGHTLTPNRVDDASQLAPLLEQVPGALSTVAADGSYDKRKVFSHLEKPPQGAAIKALIPPRKNAKIQQHSNRKAPPLPRDQIIRAIREKGRARWKKDSGYHQRSWVETLMFRYKQILGNTLRARLEESQFCESRIACLILNRMLQIAKPQSYPVEYAG